MTISYNAQKGCKKLTDYEKKPKKEEQKDDEIQHNEQ